MQSAQEQEWLQLIFENISDAIILLDHQGIIRYANLAAAAMAGRSTIEEVLDIPYADVLRDNLVYDEDSRQITRESFPSTYAFEQGVTTKGKIIRQINLRDGKQYWLSISTIPLMDASGKVRFVIVFYTDISERKSKEDKLRFMLESEKILSATGDFHLRLNEKAKLIVPLLADWCTINIISEDGSVSRIVVVHRDPTKVPMLKEFADLSARESTAPHGINQVIKTGMPEFYPTLDAKYLYGGSTPSPERIALAQELAPRSAMIIPIISRGKVLGVLSLAYSESDRRYDEQDLEFMQEFCYHLGVLVENARLYQEIEGRDKAKDSFLAALSHELRNPIAPIRSSLELMRMTATDQSTLEHVSIIEHQFENMTRILNDLLDVTRFVQNKIQLEKKVIDLRALIERMLKGNQGFLSKKKIALHTSYPEERLFVLADETRIEQALTNIVHNAEKFTPVDGEIWITLKETPGEAIIEIRDNGVGIREADLQKIFDRYYQGSNNGQHKNGLGLGLVLVREIINLHGGSIEAQSKGIGHGTTFIVRIPLTAKPTAMSAPPAVSAKNEPSRKILVVDDNEAAARGLKKLLEYSGHLTHLAHSGGAALEAAEAFNPEVVLLDIGLPDIDGYEVARRFRERYGAEAVLVALTGYGQEDDKQRAAKAGFNYHLTKPAGIEDIKAILAKSEPTEDKAQTVLENS